MAKILAERRSLYASAPDRLSGVYLCTSAANGSISLYAFCADLAFSNSYRLNWSHSDRFIERESEYFSWISQISHDGWGWLPECFRGPSSQRSLEGQELRLLTYAALGYGVQAISYFIRDYPGLTGYHKIPLLEAEIKRLNVDLRKLTPLFAAALPLEQETVGGAETGLRVSTLWSGDAEGLVIVIRNLDYKTDHKPNEGGANPRFRSKLKEMAQVDIRRPSWLKTVEARDALTDQPVPSRVREDTDTIQLDVGTIELGKVIVIQNAKATAKP